jgi:hypothetical protein
VTLDHCGELGGNTREGMRLQLGHPRTVGANGVHGDQATRPGEIAGNTKHRDAAAPGVAEDVPLTDAKCTTQGTDVGRVVVDGAREGIRGCLGCTASTLVVQDDLSLRREW